MEADGSGTVAGCESPGDFAIHQGACEWIGCQCVPEMGGGARFVTTGFLDDTASELHSRVRHRRGRQKSEDHKDRPEQAVMVAWLVLPI